MKLEIVISAYSEKLNWIPIDWSAKSLIYRCGEAVSNYNEKILHRVNQMNQFNNFGHQDTFSQDLQKVKLILDLIKEYNHLFNKPQNNVYVEKNTFNCSNGREAEQWLNHIIWRYDQLADITVFLQGHPHDHCSNFIDIINKLSNINMQNFSFSTLPYTSGMLDFNKETVEGDYLLCEKFLKQIPKNVQKISWAAGAQFAIHKKNIYKHPIEWYKKIQNLCRQNPRSGEIMERLWWNIFDCPEITEIK
jgi:hypothetical protein